MRNDATSDVTEGQMVPWAEYQRVRADIDRLRAQIEARDAHALRTTAAWEQAERKLARLRARYQGAKRALAKVMAEHTTLRAENEKLRQAECGTCGKSLPPDGDCYSCEADRFRAQLEAAPRQRRGAGGGDQTRSEVSGE